LLIQNLASIWHTYISCTCYTEEKIWSHEYYLLNTILWWGVITYGRNKLNIFERERKIMYWMLYLFWRCEDIPFNYHLVLYSIVTCDWLGFFQLFKIVLRLWFNTNLFMPISICWNNAIHWFYCIRPYMLTCNSYKPNVINDNQDKCKVVHSNKPVHG